jgi:hypothetical protein
MQARSNDAAVAAGTLEAIKWLALLAMTLDHVNLYLWHGRWPALSAAGRCAMPLFAFVLACRLAAPGALARGVHRRVMARLALAGAGAAPVLAGLGVLDKGWWPLNIMFTLLAGTALVDLLARGAGWGLAAALALLFVAGALVEFLWFGLAYFVAAWWYCERPGAARWWLMAAACASLAAVNQSQWGLMALPVIWVGRRHPLRLARLPYLSYAYYPLHLTLLLALR